MTRTLPAAVAGTRELVTGELRAAVARLAPEIRDVCAYHLGWVDADGAPCEDGHGGKALRPALALQSARAVGADAAVALPGAVAVELVHNFSLLHDDIMDRDDERHHRPTAWTVFGEARAILAGDGLLALAPRLLLEGGSQGAAAAAAALLEATALLIDGQARDLALEGRLDVSLEEYLEMIAGKTAALIACAASIGAQLAGAGAAEVRALRRFGRHIGLAFQIVDDMLGVWGEPAVTGKPAGSDLRRRKNSFPVAAALGSGSAEAAELARLLAGPPLDDAGVDRAQALLERAGARERAVAESERHLRLALDELTAAQLEADGVAGLEEIASFVTDREL